jgi:hypothetical protein
MEWSEQTWIHPRSTLDRLVSCCLPDGCGDPSWGQSRAARSKRWAPPRLGLACAFRSSMRDARWPLRSSVAHRPGTHFLQSTTLDYDLEWIRRGTTYRHRQPTTYRPPHKQRHNKTYLSTIYSAFVRAPPRQWPTELLHRTRTSPPWLPRHRTLRSLRGAPRQSPCPCPPPPP